MRDSLPFFTHPFRVASRRGYLYRLGDLKVWPVPWRLYAVKAFLVVACPMLLIGTIAGVPWSIYGAAGWYFGPAGVVAYMATSELRDGKYLHEIIAARTARLGRRSGWAPNGLEPVPPPRRVVTTAAVWIEDR